MQQIKEIPADERQRVEAAIGELKEAVKGDDKTNIEAKTQALATASAKISEQSASAKY